jgi:hypothetical protein
MQLMISFSNSYGNGKRTRESCKRWFLRFSSNGNKQVLRWAKFLGRYQYLDGMTCPKGVTMAICTIVKRSFTFMITFGSKHKL